MWAELPTNLWADLPTAVKDGLFQEKLRRGAGAARGGGKVAVTTGPPNKICVTNTETGENRRGKRNRMAFWARRLVQN